MPEFKDQRLQIEQGFISYADSTISGSLILTTGSLVFPDLTSQSVAFNGDGSWISYTPTWTSQGTQPSINNGTISGAYKVIGKVCFYRGKLLMGSTTSKGTGGWFISLPFTASSADSIQIPVSILNEGVSWFQGLMNGSYSGYDNRSAILCPTTAFDNFSVGVDFQNPFTWGTADYLVWNGSYEIA